MVVPQPGEQPTPAVPEPGVIPADPTPDPPDLPLVPDEDPDTAPDPEPSRASDYARPSASYSRR